MVDKQSFEEGERETPYDRFERLTRGLLSVPKAELDEKAEQERQRRKTKRKDTSR